MDSTLLANLRKLGPVGLLALLWAILPALLGLYMVARLGTVAAFLSQADAGPAWFGWTAFISLAIGLGFLPVYANTFLCGWVFGWWLGCASAMLSYFAAAIIGFCLARSVAHSRVEPLIEAHEGARRVRQALLFEDRRKTLLIITLWRLSGSPFPLTNLAMASCGVPMSTYLLGTFFGLTPRVIFGTLIAATAAGTGARDIQSLVKESQHPALLLLGFLASLLVLAVIGQIARKALDRVTAEPK
jgi:uncharacterized membrane protein YdjX (TVP38/TMEM64 family)